MRSSSIVLVIHSCNIDYDWPHVYSHPFLETMCDGVTDFYYNKTELADRYINHYGCKNGRQRTFKCKLNSVYPSQANNFIRLQQELDQKKHRIFFRCPVNHVKLISIVSALKQHFIDVTILHLRQSVNKMFNYDLYMYHKPGVDINYYYKDSLLCEKHHHDIVKNSGFDHYTFDVDSLMNDENIFRQYAMLFSKPVDYNRFKCCVNSVVNRCATALKIANGVDIDYIKMI